MASQSGRGGSGTGGTGGAAQMNAGLRGGAGAGARADAAMGGAVGATGARTPAAATLMRAGGGQALDGGSMPEPWTKKSHHPFIKERTLGFHVFDGNDAKQRWVTFRAKLSDVLALPSD